MDGNMDKLDRVAKDILTAANVDMEALKMLSREELRDLFPGPDHFLRRKSIWDLCHPVVLEELRRIVAKDNVHYVKELKERWADYRTKLSFYGVYKKVLKPPMGLPADEQAIDLIISLPDMFPSGYPAPKKLSSPSEALIHVLRPTEAPEMYLRRRPLATPFILVGEEDCFLCAGNAPVVSFDRSSLAESVLYVMAYYYAFRMTYPKCVSSVLLFLQTEVLGDAIHEKDQTAAFKRAKADWQAFLR